jgi:uncharacterized protein
MNNSIETKQSIENRHTDAVCVNDSKIQHPFFYNLKYLVVGVAFGIVFVKAEIISWFRIEEMFHLQSFFMYGVIGTAIAVGMISIWLIKRYKIKTFSGEAITFENKKFNKGQIYGGLIFGMGWAITGACPGPLFAQIGNGFLVVVITFFCAVAGTWVYGLVKEKLPG